MKTPIGLDPNKLKTLSTQLNKLLASYQVLYMNTRGYHWNITGREFFELHEKFEEVYNDLLVKVDEVAERILTLGAQTPLHTFESYLAQSDVKPHENAKKADDCVKGLLAGYNVIIEQQRSVVQTATDADDEGTASQVSDYIKEQEKLVWMLHAYLT